MSYEFLCRADIGLGEAGDSIQLELNEAKKYLRITLFKDDRYQDQLTIDLVDEFGDGD